MVLLVFDPDVCVLLFDSEDPFVLECDLLLESETVWPFEVVSVVPEDSEVPLLVESVSVLLVESVVPLVPVSLWFCPF